MDLPAPKVSKKASPKVKVGKSPDGELRRERGRGYHFTRYFNCISAKSRVLCVWPCASLYNKQAGVRVKKKEF